MAELFQNGTTLLRAQRPLGPIENDEPRDRCAVTGEHDLFPGLGQTDEFLQPDIGSLQGDLHDGPPTAHMWPDAQAPSSVYPRPTAALTSARASRLDQSAGPASVASPHPSASTSTLVGMPNALPSAFRVSNTDALGSA